MAKEPTKSTAIDTAQANTDVSSDSFISNLQKTLAESAGVVSSYDTEIDRGIKTAIESTQKGMQANTRRLESQYSREKTYAAELGTAKSTMENEARRGFATNTGILKQIYADTDKQIKDLDMRKEELILQGNMEAYNRISDLQVKSLEFKQESAQKTYSNLLQMANFGLAARTEKRQDRQQSFAEKQALGALALQYGVKVEPGETIDDVVNKAAPFASDRQRMELAQMQASINESNARISKMYEEGAEDVDLSEDDIMTFAQANIDGRPVPELNKFQWAKVDRAVTGLKKERLSNLESQAKNYTNKSKFEQDMLNQGYNADEIARAKASVPKAEGFISKIVNSSAPMSTYQGLTLPGNQGSVQSWLSSFGK
jgi:hypothetical protein